jgi:hypothetical protein
MATNRELVDQAWAEVMSSTISGAEWQKRVTYGYKGKPYNWQNTAFGRAKLLLDQVVDVPVEPPPDPTPTPSGAVNTNGQSDMVIANKEIVKPANYTNQNDFCVYISGASQRTTIGPNVILQGAYEAVKQYCSTPGAAKTIRIDGIDVSGAGGDLMHFNGADDVRVGEHALVHLHAPPPTGGEHHDAIQVQCGQDYYFGPHVFIEWPMDFPDNGFMIVDEPTQPGRYLRNVVIDRCRIYGPKAHNALQLMVAGEIISPDIQGPTGAKVSITRPRDGGNIILRSAHTGIWKDGVKRSDVYDNSGGGSSGAWPSYVLVDP